MAKGNKIRLTIEGDARSLFEAMTELQALPVQSFMRQYDAMNTLQRRMETQLREQIKVDQLPSLPPPPPQYALPPAPPTYQPPPMLSPVPEPTWDQRSITVQGVTAQQEPSDLTTVAPSQPQTQLGKLAKELVVLLVAMAAGVGLMWGAYKGWQRFQQAAQPAAEQPAQQGEAQE